VLWKPLNKGHIPSKGLGPEWNRKLMEHRPESAQEKSMEEKREAPSTDLVPLNSPGSHVGFLGRPWKMRGAALTGDTPPLSS
jgi:hypothetical protein